MVSLKLFIVLLLVSELYSIEKDNETTTTISDSTVSTTTLGPDPTTLGPDPTTQQSTTQQSTTKITTSESTVPPKSTSTPNEVPKFIVKNEEVACILLQGVIDITLNYTFREEMLSRTFRIGSDADASGSCGETEQILMLSWFPAEEVPFTLNMTFKKLPATPSTQNIAVDSVILDYTLSNKVFPGVTDSGNRIVSATGEFFKMPNTSYFTCLAPQLITLAGVGTPFASFSISSLKAEAFRNSTSEEFIGSSYDCVVTPATDNTIPIAVGVSFAVLIVLAVIAFIIGNRRRQQGYQTI